MIACQRKYFFRDNQFWPKFDYVKIIIIVIFVYILMTSTALRKVNETNAFIISVMFHNHYIVFVVVVFVVEKGKQGGRQFEVSSDKHVCVIDILFTCLKWSVDTAMRSATQVDCENQPKKILLYFLLRMASIYPIRYL